MTCLTAHPRLMAFLTLASTFLLGAAAGGFVVYHLAGETAYPAGVHDRMSGRAPGRARADAPGFPLAPPRPRGMLPEGYVSRLHTDLGLTVEQRDSIHKILEAKRQEADRLLQEFGPALQRDLDEAMLAIEAILEGDQLVRFRQMMDSDRAARRRDGGDDRPQPPRQPNRPGGRDDR